MPDSEGRVPWRRRHSGVVVAVILAIGISVALNFFAIGVIIDALWGVQPGLSENATQILTGWGGGIIGVIGALVGYKAGEQRRDNEDEVAVATVHAMTDAQTGTIKTRPGPVG